MRSRAGERHEGDRRRERRVQRIATGVLFAILVVACAVMAAGCAGCSFADDKDPYFGTTARRGKDPATFYVNAGGEPEYIDPGMMHDTASEALVNQLFEGLATYGPDAEPRPAVATSWDESKDHRFFRFHLRPDAKWSDGQPVTAHDFEYAWKRVLTPAVGSQAASNLYVLVNGEAFNRGKLKSAGSETTIRATPSGSGDEKGKLAKGDAVDILARSPMSVSTAIAPWDDAPAAKAILYDKADPKTDAKEKMRIDGAERGPADDGAWKGKQVSVLARLGKVKCNDDDDFFYLVADGDRKGVLPGCVLAPAKDAPETWALVAKHDALPTFKEGAPAPESDPVALGFVPAKDLESDASVVGVRATDDLTLEVETKDPTPYFIDLACHGTLFPVRQDVIEKWAARKGEADLWTRPENIVSNGPYVLDTWKFRYEITMKKNPRYYDADRLKIDKIVWLEVEEYSQTLNLYKAGEIDYIGDSLSLPPDNVPLLRKKKDFQIKNYLGTYWFEFNTKKAPTDDVLVRKALNLAIDKRKIVEDVTLADQTPATHYVPDYMGLGYSDLVGELRAAGKDPFTAPEMQFNPEEARRLLTKAGYKIVKDGDGYRAEGFPPLELLYNTNEGHKKIAVAVQGMWKDVLGVSVTLRNEEWKVMLKSVRDGNFQMVRYSWVADFNHAQTFLDTFLSYSPNNHSGWSSGEFDALMKKAAATPDPKESLETYRKAEEVAVDGMPKLPLYFYTKVTLVKPYVKGFRLNSRDLQLVKYMWIDPEWRTNPSNDPAYPLAEFPPPGAY